MTFTAENIFFLGAVLIFFSGGMDTKRRDIEPVASQGLMLSTVGVLTTTVVTGLPSIICLSGHRCCLQARPRH